MLHHVHSNGIELKPVYEAATHLVVVCEELFLSTVKLVNRHPPGFGHVVGADDLGQWSVRKLETERVGDDAAALVAAGAVKDLLVDDRLLEVFGRHLELGLLSQLADAGIDDVLVRIDVAARPCNQTFAVLPAAAAY